MKEERRKGVVPPRIERGSKVPETFVVSILLRDHAMNCDYWPAKITQRGGHFGRPFENIGYTTQPLVEKRVTSVSLCSTAPESGIQRSHNGIRDKRIQQVGPNVRGLVPNEIGVRHNQKGEEAHSACI